MLDLAQRVTGAIEMGARSSSGPSSVRLLVDVAGDDAELRNQW